MRRIKMIDSTLRDGEQSAGVSFTLKQKKALAKGLSKVGVDFIEAGIPVMGDYAVSDLRALSKAVKPEILLTWNRMTIEDADAALESGIKNAHFSVPSSDIQIEHKLGKSRDFVLQQTENVISYAVEKGLRVSVGAEDASRADFDFLLDFFYLCEDLGVNRVRYADTLGILTPMKTAKIIGNLSSKIEADIDFHAHNDFGMATANTVTAFESGANFLSCTINGLGERAGNAALEETVTALHLISGYENAMKSEDFPKLSKMTEEFSKVKISEQKPIVGKRSFSHEAGIHVDGLLKYAENYEAFSPSVFGRKRQIILGRFSGVSAVKEAYREIGIFLTEEEARRIIKMMWNFPPQNEKDLKFLYRNQGK